MGIYWAWPGQSGWRVEAAHAPGSACAGGRIPKFPSKFVQPFMPCHKTLVVSRRYRIPKYSSCQFFDGRSWPATERASDTEWLKWTASWGRIAHSPRDYGRRDRRSRGRHGPHPSLRAACWEPAELSMGAHECVRAHHTESFNRLIMPAPTAVVWWSVCSRPLVSTPFAVIDPSFINRRPSGSRRTASGGRSGSSGFRESL